MLILNAKLLISAKSQGNNAPFFAKSQGNNASFSAKSQGNEGFDGHKSEAFARGICTF